VIKCREPLGQNVHLAMFQVQVPVNCIPVKSVLHVVSFEAFMAVMFQVGSSGL